jgi:hypothetical protein
MGEYVVADADDFVDDYASVFTSLAELFAVLASFTEEPSLREQ